MLFQEILGATNARIRLNAHPAQPAERLRAARIPNAIPNQIRCKSGKDDQCREKGQVDAACPRNGACCQQDRCSRYRNADLFGKHPCWQHYVAIARNVTQNRVHVVCFRPRRKNAESADLLQQTAETRDRLCRRMCADRAQLISRSDDRQARRADSGNTASDMRAGFASLGATGCSFSRPRICAFTDTMMVERPIATAPMLMGRSNPHRTRSLHYRNSNTVISDCRDSRHALL
jgi:hypothetical protein